MVARLLLVSMALILAALASPAVAQAQDAWLPYVSGFGGGSMAPAFDISVVDPATASTFDIRGRKIINAGVFGGSVGVWRKVDDRRLRMGVRGESHYQKADANAQVLPISGTLGGQPYTGPFPFPSGKGSATVLGGAFLLGWSLGGEAAHAFGRVMPYAGIGGGVGRVKLLLGSTETTGTGPQVQAIGGVAFGVSHRVSAFAEYRFIHAKNDLAIGTQENVFSVKPSHVVAGFTVGLF